METIDPDLLRDDYHCILEYGLQHLQLYSVPDRFEYLRIEIDHLHNIPSYMRDDNLFRHAYYFCTERPYYVRRLGGLPEIDAFVIARYQPHWDAIRQVLLPHATTINAKHYSEKL